MGISKREAAITKRTRYLLFLVTLVSMIIAPGLAAAYGGNQPTIMGHSVGEMDWSQQLPNDLYVSGNVGIGTMGPGENLHLWGNSSSTGIYIERDTFNKWWIANSGGNLYIEPQDAEGDVNFRNLAGQSVLFIDNSAGNVGIGTTGPQQELEISAATDARILLRSTTEDASYQSWLEFGTGSGAPASTNIVGEIGAFITQADPSALKGELVFYTNRGDSSQEAMRIDDAGNVGIGIPGPLEKLHVANGGIRTDTAYMGEGAYATFASFSHKDMTGSGQYALLQGSTGDTFLNAPTGRGIYFRINNADEMVLDSSGNVGIGTPSPSQKLDVAGTVTATAYLGDGSGLTGISSGTGGLINTGSTTIGADSDSDGVGEIALQTRGTTRMTVANDGNVGIGDTTPDSGTGGQLKLDVEGNVGASQYCDQNGDNCKSITGVASLECTTVSAAGLSRYGIPVTATCPVDNPPYYITGGGCRYSFGGTGGWASFYIAGNSYRCTAAKGSDEGISTYARCCRVV